MQTWNPEGAIHLSLAATVHRFCFMLAKENHIFLLDVHLTCYPDTNNTLTPVVNMISNLYAYSLPF